MLFCFDNNYCPFKLDFCKYVTFRYNKIDKYLTLVNETAKVNNNIVRLNI